MKKIVVLATLGLVAACTDITAPVSERNGAPVYRAEFTRALGTPPQTLQQAYEAAERTRNGWPWKACPNGFSEVSRTSGPGYISPTANTRRVVQFYRILYQCY